MQGQASVTAKGAASHRAAHQLLEGGAIFRDPFAVSILGEDEQAIIDRALERPEGRFLRLFIAARSRFAEDRLAEAVGRGVRQAVVLGAGLDTFGLRNPHGANLRVFEVDHPATQEWKRARISQARFAADALSFVPVDFERQSFLEELDRAGFERTEPAFFMWLGVVPYLTREAIVATLSTVAGARAEVVFDYGEPPEAYGAERRAAREAFMARVAKQGEPLLSFFQPAEMAGLLHELGFVAVEDLGPHEIAVYLDAAAPPAQGTPGGHVVHARASA